MQGGFAGERVGRQSWIDEMGAPGGGVARHQEESKEIVVGGCRDIGVVG